jgi:hypothetical protein
MITALAIAMILVQIVGFSMAVRELRTVASTNAGVKQEVLELKRLSLNPRTRISTIETQSGPVSEEKSGRRLGRASAAHRVVVGGDPDTQLYMDLNRTPKKDDDNG